MKFFRILFFFLLIASSNLCSTAQHINIPHLEFENRTETNSTDTIAPFFPGGDSVFFNFLSEHIKYPEVAIQNELQGSVFIQFTVLSDSTISDIKTLRDVGGGCKEEVSRVLNKMLHWIPATTKGKIIPMSCILLVRFKLEQVKIEQIKKLHINNI